MKSLASLRDFEVSCQRIQSYKPFICRDVGWYQSKIAFSVFAVNDIDSLKMTQLAQYELFQLCQLIALPLFVGYFYAHSFPWFVIVRSISFAVSACTMNSIRF